MELQRKNFTGSVQAADEGVIEAMVSCFGNVDYANERVMPGAFKASLARKLPKGCWAHDWKQIVAKTLDARETDEGLVVRAQFNLETQRGREAFSDVKGGYVDEFSIGYRVIKDSVEEKSGVRELHELELYEFSPVLVGANSETALLSVKTQDLPNDPDTLANQVENWLAFGTQLVNRFTAIRDLRKKEKKEGRVISSANRARISACIDSMSALQDELQTLLKMSEPKADQTLILRAEADFLMMQFKGMEICNVP